MGSPSSRFSYTPDAWDIVLAEDEDDANPLTLKLVTDGSLAMWEGYDAPALSSDQVVYREQAVLWQPTEGAGWSRRVPEITATGPDGQIVSHGVAYGNNVTLVVPGVAMPAGKLTEVDLSSVMTTGSFRDAAEIGGHLFFTTADRYILRVTDGTGTIARVADFGASTTTDALQVFDGKLYASLGGTGPIQETANAGVSWTAAALACEASAMERVNWLPSNAIMAGSGGGTPADHLILVDPDGFGFYHVVEGNDPKVFANWINDGAGGSIKVGDPAYPIFNIVASPHVVWFAKSNGLHGFTETGRATNLTPWMERAGGGSNGLFVGFWSDAERAFAFYAHGQGLVVVPLNGTQQQSSHFVQFGAGLPNETPIWGRPRGLAPHTDGVFVAYYDGTDSYIMRLMLTRDGAWKWSGSECTIRGEEVVFLKVAAPGIKPRLWIGSNEGSTPHLYWQSLPESGSPWTDYVAGTDHRFSPEWEVYLPKDDGGSSAEKVVRRYDIVAREVGSGNTVIVDASADDGDYVEQGWISEGRRSSFLATTYQTGTWFDWRLRASNSETVPIAIETFQARMTVSPEQVDVWTFRCELSAGQGLANDAESTLDPYVVRQRVRAFQRRGPILMLRSPLSRETLTVKVEQGARIQAIKLRGPQQEMIVLTFTVSVLQAAGALYDVDQYGLSEFGASA